MLLKVLGWANVWMVSLVAKKHKFNWSQSVIMKAVHHTVERLMPWIKGPTCGESATSSSKPPSRGNPSGSMGGGLGYIAVQRLGWKGRVRWVRGLRISPQAFIHLYFWGLVPTIKSILKRKQSKVPSCKKSTWPNTKLVYIKFVNQIKKQ
jgi:hypothetical protein